MAVGEGRPELAQQKRNRDEFDQDVKLKPAVRGTGKEAATSALPAETKKEKKKNKKGDKKGDQGQDKGGTPAAPAPKGKSPSNPKPPPPKSQNANKGDTAPSNLTPRSKAVSKTAKMSAVEKAKVPCMFYAYDACRAKSCAFLHSPTEKYTGPPPRALGKAKSPAAVAAVVPAVPSVPSRNNSISWLWDTAAGRRLIGKQALNSTMMHCVRKTNTPVGFATGGGAQQGDKSLAFEDSRVIPPDEQVYVLNECPPAQSIGKTVIDRGYLFIWDPRENVPYLVPPSEIGKCKLRVPRRSRINASRVVEYVPQHDEVVKPQIVDQAANLRPINVVGSPVKVEDDAVSLSDDESFIVDPCQDFPSPPQVPEEGKEQLNALIDDVVQEIKVASFTRNEKPAKERPPAEPPDPPPAPPPVGAPPAPAPAVPEHPDDERRLVDFAEGGELRDEPRLRAEASSPEHQRTHFPKNPFCKICNIAKNTSMRVARKSGGRSDDLLDAPTAPYQQLATDSVILAKGDEHVGIGIGGIKSHHVIRDVFSGARVAYPVSKRDIPSHARNLRHFIGLRANELAPHCLIKMDEAGELQGAAEEVGMIPETSLPNRWPHKRDVREEKECCRSIHHESGLPYSLHTHSYPFACLSMSFDRPSTFDPTKTQWEALTKEKFDGVRCCFGQLVWYRLKSAGKRTLEPNMAPGLFMGWRIDPGMRYRRVLKVMDYQSFRTNGNVTVHDLPEPELFVEEGDPVFPIAAAADRALRTGDGEVPEYAIRDVPFIPEGIPAPSTPLGFKSRSVYITIERIIKFKETPGCKACTGHASSRHHTDECRKRFAELVESEKEEAKAKKAASEEATKPSKGADEAAAIRAAKASSLEPPEAPEIEAPEEGDPDIVRALLGEPASSRPSVPHTDAVPASTKKDEWVYKPSGNVLIRVHHQPRIKLFTPKDVGDCPVSVCRITPGRTTRVVSRQDGSKEDINDGWAGRFSAHRELPVFWTGITIFRLYSDFGCSFKRSRGAQSSRG